MRHQVTWCASLAAIDILHYPLQLVFHACAVALTTCGVLCCVWRQPYYDILPKTLNNMPIFWSDDELAYLEGSYILTQIEERKVRRAATS
jgi:hypothetical protein